MGKTGAATSVTAPTVLIDTTCKADAEVARAATGYSIGATPPLGLATELRIVIDEYLLAYDRGGRPPAGPSSRSKQTAAGSQGRAS